MVCLSPFLLRFCSSQGSHQSPNTFGGGFRVNTLLLGRNTDVWLVYSDGRMIHSDGRVVQSDGRVVHSEVKNAFEMTSSCCDGLQS